MNKLTFHVPCYTYIDNVLAENHWQQVLEEFSKIADSFYVLDAKGCYKGRYYDEKLMNTARVFYVFKKMFKVGNL